jgi:ATP-dependent DNA helicase RecQ
MELEKFLYRYFGFSAFRQGQKETIQALLNGQNTLAMLPTGTGKSLCYQLPAYLLKKTTIVVSPLLSLMQDQVEQMKVRGEKSVIALNSFMSPDQKREALRQLHTFRFIFLSPEMLSVPNVLSAIRNLQIGLFVVDEAHCISQWGYDFRPDYLKLGFIRKKLGNPLTLALTATATSEVREDIKKRLNMEGAIEIISSVNRQNISLMIQTFHTYHEKQVQLLELVKKLQPPGIIYFKSKKAAELTASYLKERGIGKVEYYHGGMEQEQRILIQQQFLNSQINIICATSAFGMGINKENVRYVIHFHPPGDMESYVQEIGRAGRDGKQSTAILLYAEGDEGIPLTLLEQEFPSKEQIDWLFEKIDKQVHLQKNALDDYFGQIGLNEIQSRIVSYFLEDCHDVRDVKASLLSYIQHRKEVKMEKLRFVMRWIQSKDCRRKGILDYFHEHKLVQTPCCDRCDDSMIMCTAQMESMDDASPLEQEAWQQELAKILLTEKIGSI